MNKEKTKKEKMDELAKKLRIVGDPSRLKIMCLIFADKKICVSDIAKRLGISVASISYHLQSLAEENLLEKTREGKNICYNLPKSDMISDLKKFICKYK